MFIDFVTYHFQLQIVFSFLNMQHQTGHFSLLTELNFSFAIFIMSLTLNLCSRQKEGPSLGLISVQEGLSQGGKEEMENRMAMFCKYRIYLNVLNHVLFNFISKYNSGFSMFLSKEILFLLSHSVKLFSCRCYIQLYIVIRTIVSDNNGL